MCGVVTVLPVRPQLLAAAAAPADHSLPLLLPAAAEEPEAEEEETESVSSAGVSRQNSTADFAGLEDEGARWA